jgi:hypothetical protein
VLLTRRLESHQPKEENLMNSYVLTQLANDRHNALMTEAREYRRAKAARAVGRFHRRGTGRSPYQAPRA